MRQGTRARVIGAVAVLGLATMAGCAPGSSGGGSTAPSAASSGAVATDVAAMGDITLTVWDQEVREGQASQFTSLIAAFEKKYPNVTVERNAQAFDDLNTTLSLALTDPNPPDVVQANNSRDAMGAFVKAGQLTDLTPYAAAYGWTERFPQTVLKNSMYTADGKEFGTGNLYGLPQMGEIVGVFYNKAKLAELGLQLPTTWSQFTDQLATAKAKGVTPLVLGNLEGWPAGHVLGPIQGALVPSDQVVKLGMGNPGASWNTAENLAAVTELARWIDEGYFNDGVNGINDQKSAEMFARGDSLFYLAGSWNGAALKSAMKADVGFFAPPPAEAGGAVATTGGTSLPFAVPAGSKHQAAAAAFIDFVTSDDAMKVLAGTGNLPVLDAGTLVTSDDVAGDIAKAFEDVSANGTLLPYLDWATPTFADDALVPRLQDLFAKKIKPQGVIDAFEKNYADYVASLS